MVSIATSVWFCYSVATTIIPPEATGKSGAQHEGRQQEAEELSLRGHHITSAPPEGVGRGMKSAAALFVERNRHCRQPEGGAAARAER